MSIIRNFEWVAYAFQEEHVCEVCFATTLHPLLQNLCTLELATTCRQNLDLVKTLKCLIRKSVITIIRRNVRQVTTKHPFVEVHLENSPTYSQIEVINARVHMSPTSILWYNDYLMKVTTDFLNVCRVGSDGRSGIPNVEQPQLFKRDDISLKNPSMHSNESVNPFRTSTPIIVNSGAGESQLARDTTVAMNESLHAQQNYCWHR